jgi:hypothetical protein
MSKRVAHKIQSNLHSEMIKNRYSVNPEEIDLWQGFLQNICNFVIDSYEIDKDRYGHIYGKIEIFYKPTKSTWGGISKWVYYEEYLPKANVYKLGVCFGFKTLAWDYFEGVHEYDSTRYLLRYKIIKGYQALLFVALHELSHLILAHRTQLINIPSHGDEFCRVYEELIELFDAHNPEGLWTEFLSKPIKVITQVVEI